MTGRHRSAISDAGSACNSLHYESGALLRPEWDGRSLMASYARRGARGSRCCGRHGTRALRSLTLEFVGTLVANVLVLGVSFTATYQNMLAQQSTMLDTFWDSGAAMPPGRPAVRRYVPDPDGGVNVWDTVPPVPLAVGTDVSFRTADGWQSGRIQNRSSDLSTYTIRRTSDGLVFSGWQSYNVRHLPDWQPGAWLLNNPVGHASEVRKHTYVVYPADNLLVAVGIGLAYGMGILVSPGTQLNPTFTIATALFDAFGAQTGKWRAIPAAILGQTCGGVLACGLMHVMWRLLLQVSVATDAGYSLMDAPKTMATAQLYGVLPPNPLLTSGMSFFASVFFVTCFVVCIVPIFAQEEISGDRMHPIAKPFLVSVVVVPFVLAETYLGVQANASMYISGLIFCSCAGWDARELWSSYIWVVVAAPVAGAVLGAVLLSLWLALLYSPSSPCVWREETDDEHDPELPLAA